MSVLRKLKQKHDVVKADVIPCFRFWHSDGTTDRLDFIPTAGVPGFSHRVAWNGKLTSKYLGDSFPPSQTVALDMLDLLREQRAASLCSDCPQGQPGAYCDPCPYKPPTPDAK